MDFLNFDFSIGMARIGQLCRSRVARSAAFHSKDASLETARSCLIPYLPVSSLYTATVHERRMSATRILGKPNRKRESCVVARRKKSSIEASFTGTREMSAYGENTTVG